MAISREEVEKLLEKPRFVAWLKGKPRWASYDFASNTHCVLAEYLTENGLFPTVGGYSFSVHQNEPWGGKLFEKDLEVPGYMQGTLACQPRTYGALLTRLEEQ